MTSLDLSWRPPYACLIAAVFSILYVPTLYGLVRDWSSHEDYSHGFLVLPISLYLVWIKRDDITSRPLKSSWLGLIMLLAWSVLYVLGIGAEISTFERVSLIVFLLGIALFLAGREIAGILMFPILFLLFMIPVPAEIYGAVTNPLELLATTCSVSILQLFEIPVLQEGNLIRLPNCSMEVLSVCSGIRSLIAIIALSLLMGYSIFSSTMERCYLLAMSIPVSIIGNVFRITVTGLLAYTVSSQFAQAYSHTVAGVSGLMLSLFCLLVTGEVIQWVQRKRRQFLSWRLR